MSGTKLRIIHETNPKKYFPALFNLCEHEPAIKLVSANRYSVVKEWFRSWIRDKSSFQSRTLNAISDLILRLKIPFIKNEAIVIGFAPWDWRILAYSYLAKNNTIIYHTSWHDWNDYAVPRRYRSKTINKFLKGQWLKFLECDNVKIVAVTKVVADALSRVTNKPVTVIPHAVPRVFYEKGKQRKQNNKGLLKLLYVGEISEKKGIKQLLKLMDSLAEEPIQLTVVGAGPLANLLETNTNRNIQYLGPIYNRERVASIMADHDVFVLLSQKTETWEELFGIVIIEALAAGCCVVCTDHVGPREILGPSEKFGVFSEADIENIARLLKSLKSAKNIDTIRNEQNVAFKYCIEEIKKNWKEIVEK